MVEPNYPAWQRSVLDLSSVIPKANAITLQQQSIDQNKVMNPLEAAQAQQRLDAETRANVFGNATQADLIAKTKAEAEYAVKSALSGMDYLTAYNSSQRTQAVGTLAAYVQAHPDSADAVTQELVNEGFIKQEDAATWKQHALDPVLGPAYVAAGNAAQQTMVTYGPPVGSYGKADAAAAAVTDREFAKVANAATNRFIATNSTATQAEIDAYYQAQIRRMKGQPALPAAPAAAPPATDYVGAAKNAIGGAWDYLNAPNKDVVDASTRSREATLRAIGLGGGPPAAAAATPPPAEAAPSPEIGMPGEAATSGGAGEEPPKPAGERAGSVKDDQAKWTKMIQGNDGAPVATFTGDPNDEAAVKAWINSLDNQSFFMPPGHPGLGRQQKHSNFK
jgi:hypothetical protein